jgi:hypothetical protein
VQNWTLPYRDVFQTGYRPYLAVHVTAPSGRSGDVVGVVDSGADSTSLPEGFAALMGYDASELLYAQGEGAGGAIDTWRAQRPCTAYVVGLSQFEFEFYPSFIAGGQDVLWGRADLFRTFGVMFEEEQQRFTLFRQ